MSGYDKPKTTITKTVTKVPTTKLGEVLQVKLLKDAKIQYLRIFIGSPEGEVPFEILFHRPIGVTDLDDDKDWVHSTPADVAHLMARINDPHIQEIRDERTAFMKDEAVKAALVAITDNVVSYAKSNTDRNTFLKPLREEVKKEAKQLRKLRSDWLEVDASSRVGSEPQKPDEGIMLLEKLKASGAPEAKEEIAFSEFMSDKANKQKAELAHPSTFRTMKGAYFDTPQCALVWANGLTIEELQGEIAKYFAILTGRDPGHLGPKISAVLKVGITPP